MSTSQRFAVSFIAYVEKEKCATGQIHVRVIGEIKNSKEIFLRIVSAISEIPELNVECPHPLIIITDVANIPETSI